MDHFKRDMTQTRRDSLKRLTFGILTALSLTLSLSPPCRGQTAQQPRSKNPAPVDNQERSQPTRASNESEDLIRLAIGDLANQISLLTDEVKRLRRDNARNSAMMELLLSEERLGRTEDKIQDAVERKAQLDGREQDLQRRMKNIQQELIFRGAIRREEAETALRAELQRAVEDVHKEQATYQQRISELQAQADRLKARIAALRKRLEGADEKAGDEKQK